jgi:hypothetical protein
MKIRYFSNFCTSRHCKEKVELIGLCHKVWGYGTAFELTYEDDYTHAVLLNIVMPNLKPTVTKERVIGFAFEPPPNMCIPPEYIAYAQEHVCRYYIGKKGTLPDPFVEGNAFLWHIVPQGLPHRGTREICSMMVSEKTCSWGHRYRHQLVNAILKTNLPIHIYGRGCSMHNTRDIRLHGPFRENDTEMYSHYHFHIAIENYSFPEYMSEKVINPLLCGTVPLYWGCHTIHTHFPDWVHTLSGNLHNDMQFLTAVVKNPFSFMKNINIAQVHKKTNVLCHLPTLFQS